MAVHLRCPLAVRSWGRWLGRTGPGVVRTVLVDMRERLRRPDRPNRVFEVGLAAARAAGLVGRRRVLDSTPLYDAVATMDTVTLIRSAVRGPLSWRPASWLASFGRRSPVVTTTPPRPNRSSLGRRARGRLLSDGPARSRGRGAAVRHHAGARGVLARPAVAGRDAGGHDSFRLRSRLHPQPRRDLLLLRLPGAEGRGRRRGEVPAGLRIRHLRGRGVGRHRRLHAVCARAPPRSSRGGARRSVAPPPATRNANS